MVKRCLIIADDLTGGADTGVQFSQKGLTTFLITARNARLPDLATFRRGNILVVNTDSRILPASEASSRVSNALHSYSRELFPIVYKKIDSTLRGNIGAEVDAALTATGIRTAFMAPSFPGQNRTLAGGIMTVAGKPIALTEIGKDAVSPVKESHIRKLVQRQTSLPVGRVDLTVVRSGIEQLRNAVVAEMSLGKRIIIFDAVRQSDLTEIAEVAFSMEHLPLLVGSAGLASEVAGKISPPLDGRLRVPQAIGVRKHLFIVSGSASSVTHKQLERLERNPRIESFEIGRALLAESGNGRRELEGDLCRRISGSLSHVHAILKAPSERLAPSALEDRPVHEEIARVLGSIASSVLERLGGTPGMDDLAIVLTGGDTAMSVLDSLSISGLEIVREITGGIALSRVFEGKMEGLAVVTKAGGFGEEDALETIMAAFGEL